MKKFFMIIAVVLLALIPIVPMQQTYAKLVMIINPAENTFTINGDTYILKNKTITDGRSVFVPLREVYTNIGYGVEWDADANAVVCTGDGNQIIMIVSKDRINVNSKMINVKIAPFFYESNLYISTEILQKSTGLDVQTVGFTPGRYDNGIDNTVIDDSLRTQTVRAKGSILISGTRAMESIVISGSDDYASIVSQAAAMLPGRTVYNMVVPTGAEYYAEKGYSIKDSVSQLYKKLDPQVVAINVFDALDEHKGENIYFRTDHHWTQRGAYYAYKKMLEFSHRELPSLSEFPIQTKSYVGSMASFLSGTAYAQLIKDNPDEIEYFTPIAQTSAEVYNDMWLTQKARNVSVVSASGGYLGFIGGDAPVTAIKTNCESDKKLLILKESYGNALATWAVNNYREIYVVDPRYFNNEKHPNSFKLADFCNYKNIDDILFINYPGGVSSADYRNGLRKML